jgi:hypothetical protein
MVGPQSVSCCATGAVARCCYDATSPKHAFKLTNTLLGNNICHTPAFAPCCRLRLHQQRGSVTVSTEAGCSQQAHVRGRGTGGQLGVQQGWAACQHDQHASTPAVQVCVHTVI